MPRKKKKPFKRLPNGFGSIKKLSGKRRNPYYVCGPERRVHGVKVPGEKIGSAQSWEEAYQMLALWWAGKEEKSLSGKKSKYTFTQIYEMYWHEKYELSMKTYGKDSKYSTQAAFKNCSPLHDMRFTDIGYGELQDNLDALATREEKPLKYASLELVLSLYHGMYKYAIKHDLAEKDYSQYVEIRIPDDDEQGVPLTLDELKIVWENIDIPEIQVAAILCYSGWRISEFANITIDLKEMIFYGGMKTPAGKGRTVPIHPRILPLVKDYLKHPVKSAAAYRKSLYPILDSLGMLYFEKDDKVMKHTPHDFRHTFMWLCDDAKVDVPAKKIMAGHRLGPDVSEKKYGHRTIDQLREEIKKLP